MHKILSNSNYREGVQVLALFLSKGSQTLYKLFLSPLSADGLQAKEDWEGQPSQNQKRPRYTST